LEGNIEANASVYFSVHLNPLVSYPIVLNLSRKYRIMLNIIFIYHKSDKVTKANWERMAKFNSNISPVSDDLSDIPNTWRMLEHKIYVPDRDKYWNCDTKVYNWTINNRDNFNKNSRVISMIGFYLFYLISLLISEQLIALIGELSNSVSPNINLL
jgi:hypothetical protein